MTGITLKGITWGHSRGITPLLAIAQRYSELYPGVEITWKKRSLQEFADYPIEKLTKEYDLLIIDHPWVGCAAATECVIDLKHHLSPSYLQDQLDQSVGRSHQSYNYENGQWALAIDAAAPAASYRSDLLQKNKVTIPQTWEEVLALASLGKLAVPAIPIDLLMNFYTFCIATGEEPFHNDTMIVEKETGIRAITTMKQLYAHVDKKMFACNPIAVAELMTSTDDYWYCPFAYGYTNYSRKGYASRLLRYTDVITIDGHERLSTTLGGTGLSVSAFSQHKEEAIRFAEMTASREYQSSLYVQHGGQPGHRSAWINEDANRLTHNFFNNLLPLMERSYMRPRYNGYLYFQDHAGHPLQQCLLRDTDPGTALDEMNKIYRQSRSKEHAKYVL